VTRIFDALKKAQVRPRPAVPAVPAAMPSPPRPLPAPFTRPAQPGVTEMPAVARYVPRQESLADIGPLGDDVARQMTSLRVGIESALGANLPRTILILSSRAGEGATSVACQLAVSLAREGRQRTLLIDFHAQRPRIGGEDGWLARRTHAKRPDGSNEGCAGCLDVLLLPDEVREAGSLSIPLAREILETLSSSYDWVIVDGPPALESAEAAALSPLVDGTVVVVHAGRTKRPVLTRTVDLLRKSGGRVLGTVLNRRRLEIPGFIYRRL
jgi:Mrp family chromosome partitioning ATPase